VCALDQSSSATTGAQRVLVFSAVFFGGGVGVREQLVNLKKSGDYKRIVTEVSERIQAASTLPVRCASPSNLARAKRSSPFFATQATNINQRSSIAIGWLPIIWIQTFP
jgi:hypothetical protein